MTEAYAFEPMAAAELVDEALKSFQLRLGENGVRVDVDVPDDLPFVRADQRAMVLALKNLIDNGLRHARGGEHGNLRIAVRRVGPNAFIEVQDNGCGISAKNSPRFVTASRVGRSRRPTAAAWDWRSPARSSQTTEAC